MTNREKYKQAFSVLRASDDFSLEANDMKQTAKQFRLRKAVVLAAACAMVIGSASIAYTDRAYGQQRAQIILAAGERSLRAQAQRGIAGLRSFLGRERHRGVGRRVPVPPTAFPNAANPFLVLRKLLPNFPAVFSPNRSSSPCRFPPSVYHNKTGGSSSWHIS